MLDVCDVVVYRQGLLACSLTSTKHVGSSFPVPPSPSLRPTLCLVGSAPVVSTATATQTQAANTVAVVCDVAVLASALTTTDVQALFKCGKSADVDYVLGASVKLIHRIVALCHTLCASTASAEGAAAPQGTPSVDVNTIIISRSWCRGRRAPFCEYYVVRSVSECLVVTVCFLAVLI